MRILVVGAGGTGGYVGARLAQAGRDVTFLVRPRRAEQLASGLRLTGLGREEVVPVRTVTAEAVRDPYDVVVVAVKALALPDALEQLRPAVGPGTLVLPFLNGLAHLQTLTEQFGADAVLGGIVRVVTTVTDDGAIHRMNPLATLTFGTQSGEPTDAARRLLAELSVPGLSVRLTDDVVAAMWHKWAFITAAGVVTCLMRGPVGDILAAPGGERFVRDVVAETEGVAAAAGHPVTEQEHAATLALLTEPGSGFTSSLYRDVTAGAPHEGEHLLGHFVATADALGLEVPLTRLALLQLRTGDRAGTEVRADPAG